MIKNFCCYKITNLINGKIYIGKTSADTNRRWTDHFRVADGYGKKQAIHSAIAKYGKDNFSFEILKYFETEKSAYNAEIKYIKRYHSYGEGYNETPGGAAPGGNTKKLNHRQIRSLIKDYAFNDLSCWDLSLKYNLSKPCVLGILHRNSYVSCPINDAILYQVWLKINCSYSLPKRVNPNSPTIKLNEEDIRNIFKDFVSEKFTNAQIAEKYKVREGNIEFILSRETWSHIKIHHKTLKKATALYKLIDDSRPKYDREELKEKIFIDFKNGMSRQTIADKHNLNLDRVLRILNNSCWKNIPLDSSLKEITIPKRSKLSEQTVLEIIQYYCKNSVSVQDVCSKFSIQRNAVRDILQRKRFKSINVDQYENVLKSKTNNEITYIKISKDKYNEIFEMYQKGNNFTEIAKIFNVGRKTIFNIIRQTK